MARLGPVKRHRLVAALRRNGLEQRPGKGKGSHTWFEHPSDPTRATTVPAHQEIRPPLLNQIRTQVRKSREEFERLLR